MDKAIRNRALVIALCVFSLFVMVLSAWTLLHLTDKTLTRVPQTVGQLLDAKGWSANVEPFLSRINMESSARLSDEILLGDRGIDGDVIESSVEGGRFIRFSGGGILTKYGRRPSSIRQEPERGEGPLTKEEFGELVEQICNLKVFSDHLTKGASFNIDMDNVFYVSLMDDNEALVDVENPGRGYWEMNANHIYDGYSCLSGVRVRADIRTGEIAGIAHVPFAEPDSMEENIPEKQALSVALRTAEKHGAPLDKHKIEKAIMYENDFFSFNPLSPEKPFKEFPTAKLCWVVGFEYPNGQGPDQLEVFVDCASGDVIGGRY